MKDRSIVAAKLREHVNDPIKPPILIFPEGTCINNTSVMMFKKGSFEIGCPVYPVAIKVSMVVCEWVLETYLPLITTHFVY